MNYTDDNQVLVSVFCETYNHELYIRQCLDGILMQKTDFAFEVLIHDDASTDHTQLIIKEYAEKYPDVIKPILQKENQYSKGVRIWQVFQMPRARGKYIALCEGDDYWTDPLKLQKQVDFMEAHEEYSMCFHKVEILSDEREKGLFSQLREGNYSARDIYNDWIVPTCSVLYRNGKPFETSSEVVYGDIFLWLQLAERGKLYCLGFVGAVYRRHSGSLSCGYSTATCVKLYHQYKFFEKRFPAFKDISRRKQEEQGLKGILYAPYFPGIWKYRFLYMFRHPELFFSSFFTTTILSYTPIRNYKIWKK